MCRFWYIWQMVEERYVKRLNNQEFFYYPWSQLLIFFFSILKLILHLKYIQNIRVQDLHRWSTRNHTGEVFSWIYLCVYSVYKLGKKTLAKWNETIWGFTYPFFILQKPDKCVSPINSQKKCVSEITWWSLTTHE